MLKNEMNPEKVKMIENKWREFRNLLDDCGVGIVVVYGYPSDALLFYDREIKLKDGTLSGYKTPIVNLAKMS